MRFCYGLLFLLMLTGVHFCYAVKPVIVPAQLRTDTSRVMLRSFDHDVLNKLSHQPEFNYHEDVIDNTLWIRFWRWFWHFFQFQGKGHASKFWLYFFMVLKYVLLITALSAVVFLILKLAGINVNIFRKKSASAIPYSEFFENIHEIDFDGEIENAVNQQNYRFAVRLLYLRSLKKLSDAGLIDWQIDKTNSNYINELADVQQQEIFKQLTFQFEYVWYGAFLIDQQVYTRINGLFQDFNKRVA